MTWRKTLAGHGLTVDIGEGEDLDASMRAMCKAFTSQGPVALVIKRKMAPGIDGLEGVASRPRRDQDGHGHRVSEEARADGGGRVSEAA